MTTSDFIEKFISKWNTRKSLEIEIGHCERAIQHSKQVLEELEKEKELDKIAHSDFRHYTYRDLLEMNRNQLDFQETFLVRMREKLEILE